MSQETLCFVVSRWPCSPCLYLGKHCHLKTTNNTAFPRFESIRVLLYIPTLKEHKKIRNFYYLTLNLEKVTFLVESLLVLLLPVNNILLPTVEPLPGKHVHVHLTNSHPIRIMRKMGFDSLYIIIWSIPFVICILRIEFVHTCILKAWVVKCTV